MYFLSLFQITTEIFSAVGFKSLKSGTSTFSTFKLLTSTFDAFLGGKANINLSDDLTFHKTLAMAATRETYLTVSSFIEFYLEQNSKCFR